MQDFITVPITRFIHDELTSERLAPVAFRLGVAVDPKVVAGVASDVAALAAAVVEEWSGTDELHAARRLRAARTWEAKVICVIENLDGEVRS